MHTVFSDGSVWPPVRVDEAWRVGLDAIAVTDHIEYQPHEEDVPTRHNRSYELAVGRARQCGVLLARGAEITRDTPPGHFNAIFLENVDPLETDDLVDVIKRANDQGAFVFWNHPGWKGPELGRWTDVHTQLYEKGWLHGIEVANGETYYPEAHRWCLEKQLTMMGNSDIHGPDLRLRNTAADHRTMTLVFVTERTLDGLKAALKAGRTAVWLQDRIIGRREWIEPLFYASLEVEPPHLRTNNALWVKMANGSAVDIRLENRGQLGPAELVLPADSVTLVRIAGRNLDGPLALPYTATNFLVAPDRSLDVTLRIPE